jgi:hypothetical protein
MKGFISVELDRYTDHQSIVNLFLQIPSQVKLEGNPFTPHGRGHDSENCLSDREFSGHSAQKRDHYTTLSGIL